MSYGPDLAATYRQGGVYTAPARAIGIDVPPNLVAIATDVID